MPVLPSERGQRWLAERTGEEHAYFHEIPRG